MTAEAQNNGQSPLADVSYKQIKEDLKRRKPLLAATLAGNPEILERVKEYEKQSVTAHAEESTRTSRTCKARLPLHLCCLLFFAQ